MKTSNQRWKYARTNWFCREGKERKGREGESLYYLWYLFDMFRIVWGWVCWFRLDFIKITQSSVLFVMLRYQIDLKTLNTNYTILINLPCYATHKHPRKHLAQMIYSHTLVKAQRAVNTMYQTLLLVFCSTCLCVFVLFVNKLVEEINFSRVDWRSWVVWMSVCIYLKIYVPR